MDLAYQAPLAMGFSGKNTGVGCHSLLQGIVPTQELNPVLLHCRQILYHLSHQETHQRSYQSRIGMELESEEGYNKALVR